MAAGGEGDDALTRGFASGARAGLHLHKEMIHLMSFLDIPTGIMLVKASAAQFSSEHPQHSEDVSAFVRELDRIMSELRSAVYARQKAERGW